MTTQYREILRLASLGLSGRSIAGSVSCSRNTVSEVLARAVKLGVEWPVPLEVGEADLRKLLFPEKETSSRTPDCEYIHRELAKPGVTMTLLWDEYCRKCRLRPPPGKNTRHLRLHLPEERGKKGNRAPGQRMS